jgi:hypothetical protein
MSRRSTLKRRRERKRRRQQQQKLALQLPPQRTVRTAELFELVERMAHICAEVIAESQEQS